MENERLYYIESLNRWVTYEEAHQYGYTLTKPEILTLYTDDLQAIQIRRDTSTGTLYDTREVAPHSWVTDIDVLGLYSQVGSITLYTADTPESYIGYVASLESDVPTHVDYSGDLTLISDLHDNFGITDHPCQIYLVQEGVTLSWYDADENLYWDVTKRQWQESPPSPEQPGSDSDILPFPDPVIPHYQWESDLSQLPTIQSVTGRFYPAPSVYTSLSPSHKMIEQWDDLQNLVNDFLYTDVTQTGIKIYVQAEEGVDDYLGNHYNFGDYFVGDYQNVYVESDSEDTLYLGRQPTVIPSSHDDYNPVLYYFNNEYVTPTHLHDLGYTNTYSSEVEVFDYSLLELPDSINVILYLKYDKSIASFKKVKFNYDSPDNWWWACVRQEDLQAIIDFGLLTQNTSPWGDNYFGPIGNIVWNKAVTFEVLSLYEDINTSIPIDLTQFRAIQDTQYDTNLLGIECLNKIYDQEFIAWKCRITKLKVIEVVLGIRYQPPSGPWLAKTFSDDEWWWAGILSQEDAATAQTFGAGLVTQNDSSKYWPGPIGALGYNSNLSYEIVAFYSDLGETEVSFDTNNFYLRGADSPYYPGSMLICSIGSYSTSVMSYKVRITRS